MEYRPTRRGFLKLVGAGAAWVMFSGCAQPPTPTPTTPTPVETPKPAPRELKLGYIAFRTGPAAAFGEPAHKTIDYLVEKANAAGGIAGAKIKVIHEDQGTISDTVEKAKRLCLQDKVDLISGIPGTPYALAVAQVAEENSTMFFINQARPSYGAWKDPEDPTKGRMDWVFKVTNTTTSHAVQAAYLCKELFPDAKVIAQVHQDYAFGYDNYEIFTTAMKKLMPDAELLDPLYPKLFTPDYTPYVTELLNMKPDFIFTSLWGTDFTRFIDQLLPYGLLKGTGGDTILCGYWDFYPSIGRDIPVFGHPQPANQGSITFPEFRKIVLDLMNNYNVYMIGAVADAIATFYAWKQAIEKAYEEKGEFPTNDEIRDALENLDKISTPYGDGVMRKEDHRVLWEVRPGIVSEDTKGWGLPYIQDPELVLEPDKTEPPAFMKGPDWIATW
jgi:branched-chain amino acid transport system substrate-binding protein